MRKCPHCGEWLDRRSVQESDEKFMRDLKRLLLRGREQARARGYYAGQVRGGWR